MYTYTYNVEGFEQGGFYVDNGQEYNSETEIRSGWINCGRIFTFTVETDYKWSFICRDSSGNFIYISEAYNYKTGGTKIDLSKYPNVSDIRIELNDTSGINPPAACTLLSEFAWTMGANGKPTNEYMPNLPENPLTKPYPKTMWRIVDGKPTHDFLSNLPENPLTKPYPKTMWRIDKSRNNGKPYHEYLPGIRGLNIWSLKRERTIRVYDISEPQDGFKHNGFAVLDPISCVSLKNQDTWDVTLTHPIDTWGKWKYLLVENILKVDGQLFRINIQENEVSADGNYVTVHANHITCDMSDDLITNATFAGGSAESFLQFCFENGVMKTDDHYHTPYRFNYFTDLETTQGECEYVNVTLWGAIVGVDNCMLNRYGGELYRNNFYFSVCKRMENARDNAFNLRYSLDMIGIKQKIDYSEFCTNMDCVDNFGNGYAISYTHQSNWAIHHQKRRMFQFNYDNFETAFDQLCSDAEAMWNKISIPKVTYEVKMAALASDPRYSEFQKLKNYNYGDSGVISCPELDISTTQKITEIEKDEITGDILTMRLGNIANSIVRPTFMGSTISNGNTVEDKQNKIIQNAIIGTGIANAEKYSINRLETLTINELQGR